MSSTSSSNIDSSSSASAVEPTWRDCLYFAEDPVTGCKRYRRCGECLQTPGCRVEPTGLCGVLYADEYAPRFDYRLAIEANASLPVSDNTNMSALESYQEWMFPSKEVAYCSANDATCTECIAEKFWLTPGQPRDSRFCVGENGCVCIANCVNSENYLDCPSPTPDYAGSMDGWPNLNVYIGLCLGAIALIAICCCFFCFCRLCQETRPPRSKVPVATIVASPATEADQGLAYAQPPPSTR